MGRQRLDLLRWMPAIAITLAVALFGIAGWMLYDARQAAWRQAAQQADNVSLALERDIAHTFAVFDLSLRAVAAGLPLLDRLPLDPDMRRAVLFDGALAAPYYDSVLVIDAAGMPLYSSSKGELPRENFANQSYFLRLRDHPDAGLAMTPRKHGGSSGRPAVVLSRRINHADGSFAGIVSGAIDVSLFEDLFSSLKLAPADDVTVVGTDGRLLYRRLSGAREFGRDMSASPNFPNALYQRSGLLDGPSATDGVHRLRAYRRVGDLPLIVSVGLAMDDAYAAWRQEALVVGGAVLVLLTLALLLIRQRELGYRSRTAATVRDHEARYRLLADNTTDFITCLDLEFRHIYASPACRAMFGREPDEMLGCPLIDSIHPDEQEETLARLRRLAAGESDREIATYRARHRLGPWLWVEANIDLVREPEGAPASLICSMRDITRRQEQSDALRRANVELERLSRHIGKARDAAEQASRAKSLFLAGMSHELRTPLNGILGYAQLLRLEGGLGVTQAARVDAMLAAGGHLLEMINCVLDLSEIEAGRVELRMSLADPRQLAVACLDLLRPAAEAKSLSLDLIVAPDLPERFIIDTTRLRQVLLNLLGNAVKFTAEGKVALHLRPGADDVLRIEVADTGPGVPLRHRDRLFKDFERLGAELRGPIEGAGLGLAIASRLVALMGGRLGYEDNHGGGSLFWLELPALAAESSAADEEPPASVAFQVTTASLRILVVDDVAMNRDIASAFLQAAGHEALVAEGGAEAVAAVAAGDFDVVLMDVRMPEVDGLEAARRIRRLADPRGSVPIVALTAQAFAEQIEECRRAGMDGHLTKPFTQAALLDAVARATTQSDRPRAASAPAMTPPALSVLEPQSDLKLIDMETYERTAAFLPPDTISSYLRILAGRGEALLVQLRAPGLPADPQALAAEAHALSGSAGMLGFARLAGTARDLETALLADPLAAGSHRDRLAAAIELSIREMQRLPVAASASA